MNSTIIGVIASVFTSISLLPQAIKLYKEKQAKDVSIGMLVVLFTGLCLWVWYGFLEQDMIIIIANIVSIVINLITTALTLKYRKR